MTLLSDYLIEPQGDRAEYSAVRKFRLRLDITAFLLIFLTSPGAKPLHAQVSTQDPHPTSVEACSIADNALGKGDWETARAKYLVCIDSDPQNFGAFSNMGIALSHLGRMQEAVDSYETALKLEPNNPKIEFNLSISLVKAGNYARAVEHLKHLQQPGSDIRNEELLAFCYYHLEQYLLAVRAAEKVYAIQPKDPANALILGSAYTRLGMFDKALPLITLALKAAGSAEGHLIMAQTLLGLHLYHEAMGELEEASSLDAHLPGLRSAIGAVDVGIDKPNDAKLEFQKALDQNPNDYEANYFMGRLKRLDGDTASASDYLAVANRLHPNSPEVEFEWAALDISEHRYADAVPLLEDVIKAEPDQAKAYLMLSVSYQRTGRKEEAQKEGELYNAKRLEAHDKKELQK